MLCQMAMCNKHVVCADCGGDSKLCPACPDPLDLTCDASASSEEGGEDGSYNST
jgi:hypothetical protein